MNPSEQHASSDQPGSGSVLAELHGGGSGGDEPAQADGLVSDFASAAPSRRVSLTNVMIAVVLVVSAASLYMMRQQGKGAGMTFEVSRIDYQLDAPKTEPEHARTAAVLAELASTITPAQVPVDRIYKNPFLLEVPGTGSASPDPELERQRLAEQERQEQERRKQQIQSRLGALQLNGVMGGPVPLARISGRTVRVGDVVAETFTVTAIHSRSVDLAADGQTYTLDMLESNDTPRRRPGRTNR